MKEGRLQDWESELGLGCYSGETRYFANIDVEFRDELTREVAELREVGILELRKKLADSQGGWEAGELFEKLYSIKALFSLVEGLNHRDYSGRKNAAFFLGKLGDRRALPFLVQALMRNRFPRTLSIAGDPWKILYAYRAALSEALARLLGIKGKYRSTWRMGVWEAYHWPTWWEEEGEKLIQSPQ